MSKSRRLLFIVNVDWFFLSHRLPIAIEAIKQGYEVHLACAVTDKLAQLHSHGIVVHSIELSRSGSHLASELKTIIQLYRVIRNVQPHVLHTVTIKPVLYGNLIARILKVPKRVVSISGLGYVYIAQGLRAKLLRVIVMAVYRLALKGVESIIFQNSCDRDTLRSFGAVSTKQEVHIKGSGVQLDLYPVTDEPQSTPVVMLVARLLIDKGVNEFVAAARILIHSHIKIRMVLVGDIDLDNPKSIDKKQLSAWVASGYVEHWGYCSNIAETISKSNLVVLPSYREGLPKSLIEAAACGRAVITTDVPGCRDAIEPNRTGLLVPVKSEAELADAILKLLSDAVLRKKLATRARFFAQETFDIRDVIKKHMSIYSQKKIDN